MAQQKKEEEERLRKEEADKKAKEAEEKRKRLEEAEKKRQAMMQAQKEKQQAAGQGSKGPKKTDSGVSLLLIDSVVVVQITLRFRLVFAWLHKGEARLDSFTPNRLCNSDNGGDRGGNFTIKDYGSFPRQSPPQSKIRLSIYY